MLFHRRFQYLLPPYVFGDLPENQVRKLETHLQNCKECRSELEQLRRFNAVISRSPLPEPAEEILREARSQFRSVLQDERRRADPGRFSGFWAPVRIPRPAFALGLVVLLAVGILAGRYLPPAPGGSQAVTTDVVPRDAVRITNMQLIGGGAPGEEIELTFDAVKPVHLRGTREDPEIQKVLAYALVNSDNPGVRLRAVGSVTSRSTVPLEREMKGALLLALRTDRNDGVRKAALQAILGYPGDREVRDGLIYVLLNDGNPGLRIAAINGLDTLRSRGYVPDEEMIRAFRESMRNDENLYVRTKAQTIIGVKQQ
jgi:HEAT repeats/Putative zinc-finger